jgi:hypothetical protein
MYYQLEKNVAQLKQETNRVLKNLAPHVGSSSVLFFVAV